MVVRGVRDSVARVQFPAPRRAYGSVVEHGIRIAGTAVQFRLGPPN